MRFSNTKPKDEGGFEPSASPQRRSPRRKGTTQPSTQAQWRAQQLCAQVREVVELCLADWSDNPLIEPVVVVSVEPAPDASRLCVTVTTDTDDGPVDVPAILDALSDLRPALRQEIAGEINRKKTPTLVFCFAPNEMLDAASNADD